MIRHNEGIVINPTTMIISLDPCQRNVRDKEIKTYGDLFKDIKRRLYPRYGNVRIDFISRCSVEGNWNDRGNRDDPYWQGFKNEETIKKLIEGIGDK